VEDLYIEENLEDQSIDNIKSFKPFKSPGPDGFFLAQLQRTLVIYVPWLTAIFHGCLVLKHIPTRWLDVKVIFITKAGQTLPHQPKELPPDKSLSFLLKTLERLIDIHIRLTINPSLLSPTL